jgi:hypothetical protein
MKNKQVISNRNKGQLTTTKLNNCLTDSSTGKVTIHHIPRLRPNSKICSLVGRNTYER